VYGLFGFAAVRISGDTLSVWGAVPLIDAFWGALLCGGFFALITVITRGRGMGIGDAYIAAGIGAMLGLEAGVVSGVFAVWIGALLGIALLLTQAAFKQFRRSLGIRHVTLKTEIPFAPFLALGAYLTYITGYAPVLLGAIGLNF
jgi:leader peptidase (prepilin peptidase)/N-methyltransferase